MKKPVGFPFAFGLRFFVGLVLCSIGLGMAFVALAVFSGSSLSAQGPSEQQQASGPKFGPSYKNDISPALRDLPAWNGVNRKEQNEANENPKIPYRHNNQFDP